ncbi:MAG: 1-(5-phosphoribosyl)-5-[(5-phosphoribosylamino)methylideneamino]imidazole-4-carboxamide isomerase [Blastocatellia bacterium]|nr:1-(5-phosphoribosyl)-5-[(5-phosphoribosylamino)methylideneamino]imidazole-4-carboxamide isomerase [Blastocatellia bacterium]
MIIFPAIDLKEGRCVRLRQGEKAAVTVYSGQPAEIARQWQDQGATWLHLVNLDGAFDDDDTDNTKAAEQIIREVNLPIQFGGGVRSLAQVRRLVEIGVERIVLGTMAIEEPDLLQEMTAAFGSQIVIGIDARDGMVTTHGWATTVSVTAMDFAKQVGRMGGRRIVYTDISRDGMLSGPNFEMTRQVAHESGLQVTASGGIASLDDIRRLRDLLPEQIDSCIVGKALYEGRFTLAEAIAAGA